MNFPVPSRAATALPQFAAATEFRQLADAPPSVEPTRLFRLSEFEFEFHLYDVDSDGERFLFAQRRLDQPAVQTFTVVQNWFSEEFSNGK